MTHLKTKNQPPFFFLIAALVVGAAGCFSPSPAQIHDEIHLEAAPSERRVVVSVDPQIHENPEELVFVNYLTGGASGTARSVFSNAVVGDRSLRGRDRIVIDNVRVDDQRSLLGGPVTVEIEGHVKSRTGRFRRISATHEVTDPFGRDEGLMFTYLALEIGTVAFAIVPFVGALFGVSAGLFALLGLMDSFESSTVTLERAYSGALVAFFDEARIALEHPRTFEERPRNRSAYNR